MVFNKCLLNAKHDLKDDNDATFYSYLFEAVGISVNRKSLKKFVRRYVYVLLGLFVVCWQLMLGIEPLLF